MSELFMRGGAHVVAYDELLLVYHICCGCLLFCCFFAVLLY